MNAMLKTARLKLANLKERFFHRTTPAEINLIKSTRLFDDVDDKVFAKLVSNLELIHYAKDQLIFNEGDEGDAIYIIKSGSVRVFTKNGALEHPMTLANLKVGDYFGEQALIKEANKTRNANIETTSDTTLIKVGKEILETILHTDGNLKLQFKQRGRQHAIEFLSKLSQFSEIEHILTHVNARLAEFDRGQCIFAQGDVAENIYIILNGKIELLIPRGDHKPLHSITLHKGNIFGEVGVITQQSRVASAIAVDNSSLLVIDGQAFKQYLAQHPTIKLMLTALQHTYQLPKQGIVEQYVIQDTQMGSAIVNIFKLESGISVTAVTALAQPTFNMKVDNVKAEKRYHYHNNSIDISITRLHRQLVGIELSGHWDELEEACHALLTQREIDEMHFLQFHTSGKLHLTRGPITTDELTVICACMSVTRTTLQNCIDQGIVDFDRLCQQTGACTVCQSCKNKVLEMLGQSAWLPATMTYLHHENDDVISYQVKPISYHFQAFTPGQHIIIQTRIGDNWVERPYFISDKMDNDTFRVTIQKVPQGALTSLLFSQPEANININVSQPLGEFKLTTTKDADVLCFVEGIGMSAFIPFIKAIVEHQQHMQLHYFVPSPREILFANTLNKLNPASAIEIITHISPDDTLTMPQLQACLQSLVTPNIYICGSSTFTQQFLEMLNALKYPLHKIHHEAFTNADVPLSTNHFTYMG